MSHTLCKYISNMKTLPFNFITNRKVKQQQEKSCMFTEYIFAIPGQTSLIYYIYIFFYILVS